MVWIDGVRQPLETHQTKLRDRYRTSSAALARSLSPVTALAVPGARLAGVCRNAFRRCRIRLRAPMVGRVGERGFSLAYVLVSVATSLPDDAILWPGVRTQAPAVLWDAGSVGWTVATLLMWFGSILFVGSLRRNPAFPTGGRPVTEIGEARGVFAITRHPMMWGFAHLGAGPCHRRSDPRQL